MSFFLRVELSLIFVAKNIMFVAGTVAGDAAEEGDWRSAAGSEAQLAFSSFSSCLLMNLRILEMVCVYI